MFWAIRLPIAGLWIGVGDARHDQRVVQPAGDLDDLVVHDRRHRFAHVCRKTKANVSENYDISFHVAKRVTRRMRILVLRAGVANCTILGHF